MTAAVTTARPVHLSREGALFRLAFRFDPALLERVRRLPFASFDPDTKTWTCQVSAQALDQLRAMHYAGMTDVPVDTLLHTGESPEPVKAAELRPGRGRRPFVVHLSMRGDNTYERLAKVAGATWDKKAQALTYPATSALALAELVDRGVIDDPAKLLSPAETVVSFDARAGAFVVRGADAARASHAFGRHFPGRDVVGAWRQKNLDVAFSDPLTEEIYRGELARASGGFQPDGIRATLFPYQQANVATALARTGFLIADEMGLGKTLSAIAVGHQLLADGTVSRAIAIVPASVRSQWAAEIVRFTDLEHEQVVVVDGDPRRRAEAYEAAKTAPWLVIHYDVLDRDLKDLKPLFDGAFVIADEAHRLKSWTAKRTKAAITLAHSAARRLALTGTPMETGLAEFYQVLSGFAVPGCLGSPTEFNERYRYKARFGGYEGARNVAELRERSKVHFARHTKAEVAAHLPPLRVQQLIIDPDPAYAAALRRAHREAANEIREAAAARAGAHPGGPTLLDPDAEEVADGSAMTAVGMLRLLVSSPRLVAQSEAPAAKALRDAGIVPDEDGPKLDELRVMAADFHALTLRRKTAMADAGLTEATPAMVGAERFVVFTFSKRMANLIAARFTEDGIPHVTYTGDSSRAQRDEAVAAFTDPNADVTAFIATDAAAEGLNLGRCCTTLIQMEPAWTPSRAMQRTARIHRIDGTAPAYHVINFVLANTLEIGIHRLLADRADLQDALFGESGTRYQATGRRTKSSFLAEAMDSYLATDTSAAAPRKPAKPRAKPGLLDGSAPTLPLPAPASAPAEQEPPEPDSDDGPSAADLAWLSQADSGDGRDAQLRLL